MEKRWLQILIALGGLIPVGAGLSGALLGPSMLHQVGDLTLDSHFRYLSGLLLAIGLGYWTAIPNIEKQGQRIGILTMIVVGGGFCRALGMLLYGPPGGAMSTALLVELGGAPLVYLWQQRVARRAV
jgi:hypothetical protein